MPPVTCYMPKIDVYNTKAEKSGKITLPKEIFATPVNKQLMAQAVRVYLANQRRAHAKTKTRGEVKGSGRKIYRQKGTGRARHGDAYAPIFVGGGIAHGPRGVENWQLKMSKKMRRQALFSALTSKLKEKRITVVEGLEKVKPKTKEMAKVLGNLTDKKPATQKARKKQKAQKLLLVLPEVLENIIRAARNIKGVEFIQAKQLHPYQVLKAQNLIFLKPSVKIIKETFLKK